MVIDSSHPAYPHYVCSGCGLTASGNRAHTISTFHRGMCEICGRILAVTEARDFFYPPFSVPDNWEKPDLLKITGVNNDY